MTPAQLDITDLTVNRAGHPVLHGIHLSVARGETLAVLGANGAGKSSLLRAIMGFEPAESGCIRMQGQNLGGLAPRRRMRTGIGLCPEGRRLFPGLTVEETLAVAFTDLATSRRNRIEGMYRTFPALREKRRDRAWTLSGGQQQMLAIARAMMGQPRLMLLDEPTLGLAPMIVADVADAIRNMKQSGISVLIAEQNIEPALMVADKVMILVRGRIVHSGPASALSPAEAASLMLVGKPVS